MALTQQELITKTKLAFGAPPLSFEATDDQLESFIDDGLRLVKSVQTHFITVPVPKSSGCINLPSKVGSVFEAVPSVSPTGSIDQTQDLTERLLGFATIQPSRSGMLTNAFMHKRDVSALYLTGNNFDWRFEKNGGPELGTDFTPTGDSVPPQLYYDDAPSGTTHLTLHVIWKIETLSDIFETGVEKWLISYLEARAGVLLGRIRAKFSGDLGFETDGPELLSTYVPKVEELESKAKTLTRVFPIRTS